MFDKILKVKKLFFVSFRNQLDDMQFRMILMQMNKDRFVNYAAVSQYYCQLTILIRLGHNSLGSVTQDGLKMSHSYLMMSDVTLDTIYQITNSLLQFSGKLKHLHARFLNDALHQKNLKRLHIINFGTDFIIKILQLYISQQRYTLILQNIRNILLNNIYNHSYSQSLVFSMTFTILVDS